MNGPVVLDRRSVLAGGGALIVSFSLRDAFAQDAQRRVHLTALPFLQDDPEHLPDVPHRFEVIPAVAKHMRNPHNPPPLQLTQACAHIRARYR